MAAKVHAANIHDCVGAREPIKQLRYIFPRLKEIIADGGYRGKLSDMVKDLGWELLIVLRADESSKKFSCIAIEMDCRTNFLMD